MATKTAVDPLELFEILKGPPPMKLLCEQYSKHKRKDVFKDFYDNGDCEPNEIDWIYQGMIEHLYDGDFYAINCGVRDPYDREICIYPEVWFSVEFLTNGKHCTHYPQLTKVEKTYNIKTMSDFTKALGRWPAFVRKSAKIIEAHRAEWENFLSPAPDTKKLYYFVKDFLADDIQASVPYLIKFKGHVDGK